MDTEALTRKGWKYGAKITMDDEILTLNPLSHLLEWQKPTNVFVKKHPEKRMVSYHGKGIRFCVTPEHRFYVRSVGRGRWRWTTANDIENKGSIAFPVSAYLNRRGVEHSDDLLRLSGWMCAEGHFRTDSGMIEISQNVNTKGYQAIENILNSLNIPYSFYKSPSRNNGLFRIKAEAGHAIRNSLQSSKSIPVWLWDASPRQFRIWLNSLMDGDGSRNKNSMTIKQKDKTFLDTLQALCITHRISAVMSDEHTSSTGGNYHTLNLMDGITERIPEAANVGKSYLKDVTADEVWCLSVPNKTLVTRYKGRPLITGNCSPDWCGFFSICPYTKGRIITS